MATSTYNLRAAIWLLRYGVVNDEWFGSAFYTGAFEPLETRPFSLQEFDLLVWGRFGPEIYLSLESLEQWQKAFLAD